MPLPLEAVPNFSEGRSEETIAALRDALARHAHVLDVHVDPDHNRSVFTIAGRRRASSRRSSHGIACARERIDLRRHEGVHPRVGAADVVPVVAVWPEQLEVAEAARRSRSRTASGTSSAFRSSCTASSRRSQAGVAPARRARRAPAAHRRRRAHARPWPRPARSDRRLRPRRRPPAADRLQRQPRDRRPSPSRSRSRPSSARRAAASSASARSASRSPAAGSSRCR